MYKIITVLLTVFLFFGCKTEKKAPFPPQKVDATGIQLRFLDEYVFPPKYEFKDAIIGGLSGIDYKNNTYYIIVDDSKNPRIYATDIKINNQKIDTVLFKDVIRLDKKQNSFYKENKLDLESIVVDSNRIFVSSEGRIDFGADPTIFEIDSIGNFVKSFELPEKFLANSPEKPRNNGVFEGLSQSHDKKGFWSAMEFPLTSDGETPKFPKSNSPVRFTYFDADTYQPIKEFIYELSPLSRENSGFVNLNGLTDILEYKPNHFLVIERTYQSGYTDNENLVRIYEAIVEENTTNVLSVSSVKDKKYISMKKRLVFDFSSIKSQLTDEIIDNIEGITFGPTLSNGNQSLIVVADDNFQKYGNQINQFVLFEIVK